MTPFPFPSVLSINQNILHARLTEGAHELLNCRIRPLSLSTCHIHSLSDANSIVDELTQNQHLSTLIMSPLSFFFLVYSFLSVCDLPCSSLFLSKANSTSTGQLDKLVSPGFPALTPESEEERSLPPQRVSTFRPRPYSMADSNKVRNLKPLGGGQGLEPVC